MYTGAVALQQLIIAQQFQCYGEQSQVSVVTVINRLVLHKEENPVLPRRPPSFQETCTDYSMAPAVSGTLLPAATTVAAACLPGQCRALQKTRTILPIKP